MRNHSNQPIPPRCQEPDKKVRLPFYYALETCDRVKQQIAQDWKTWFPADEFNIVVDISFRIRLREISHIRQEVRTQSFTFNVPDLSELITEETTAAAEGVPNQEPNENTASSDGLEPSEEQIKEWEKDKVRFLTKGFARFQWEAQFFYEGTPAFKIFIDATDVPQGDAVSAVFTDDMFYGNAVLNLLRSNQNARSFKAKDGQFFPSFMRRLVEKDTSMDRYLDETYGELRAPLYLKEQEIREQDIFKNPTAVCLYDAPRVPIVELNTKFNRRASYLIWTSSKDGALIIGKELTVKIDGRMEKCGHPSITGFQPARIAGEMHKAGKGNWQINSKSGRYSGDYPNTDNLLQNALHKFQQFFPNELFVIQTPLAPIVLPPTDDQQDGLIA